VSKSKEGVIKFQLNFSPAEAVPFDTVRELNAWRKMMVLLQLIGMEPGRYGGYGFGNISQRLDSSGGAASRRQFIITGTQTGGLPDLGKQHYATVLECYPEQNRLVAEGPVKPSAESLTHGVIYALDDDVRWVLHAHSPHMWQHAKALRLPATHPDIPYGTPEMAAEVRRLFDDSPVREIGIFSMGGHEDGIVAFGHTAEEASARLINCLSRAFQCTSSVNPFHQQMLNE